MFSNELTEDNDGSKRTLTSYWKGIERNGYNSSDVSLFFYDLKSKRS